MLACAGCGDRALVVGAQRPSAFDVSVELWALSHLNKGIEFEFDDGAVTIEAEGDKETADWYASVQLGEVIPVGANPLLISAKKRRRCGAQSVGPAPSSLCVSAVKAAVRPGSGGWNG
jgi:hypothetical protein